MKNLVKAGALMPAPAMLLPAAAQAEDAGVDQWSGVYVGGRAGYGFQSGGNNETVLFDTNLDGNFNNQVSTAAGANAFSPGFRSGAATGTGPTAGCRSDSNGSIGPCTSGSTSSSAGSSSALSAITAAPT